MKPGVAPEPASEVQDRDAEVVRVIEEEGLSVFTFDGLRRITGTHPETLSRTLDRLEGDGMLAKSADGYVMTGRGRSALSLRPASLSGSRVQILNTFLPTSASAKVIVEALKGRWFDKMRWVGMSNGDDWVAMKWVTEDGGAIIDAVVSGRELEVEAKLKRESDLPGAIRAAHHIVGRISRLYASPRPGSRPMMMQIGYFKPYAM